MLCHSALSLVSFIVRCSSLIARHSSLLFYARSQDEKSGSAPNRPILAGVRARAGGRANAQPAAALYDGSLVGRIYRAPVAAVRLRAGNAYPPARLQSLRRLAARREHGGSSD